MPYKIYKEDGRYCVYKQDENGNKSELKKCYDNRGDALSYMRALYAAENKEIEEKQVAEAFAPFPAQPPSPLGNVMSFSELDDLRDAENFVASLDSIITDYRIIASNILDSHDLSSDERLEAIKNLSQELLDRLDNYSEEEEENKENEEMDEMIDEKAKWTRAYINDLPDSAFLYIEPGGHKDEEGKTVPRSKRHFPYKDASGKIDLPHLRNAIARIPQSNAPGLTAEKKRQLQERARRLLAEAQKELNKSDEKSLLDRISDVVIKAVKSVLGQDKEKSVSDFMIWKEGSTYRWIGRYSNNFRDDDNPAEIISSKSHMRFVECVDKGIYPKPQLLIWHIPEWKIGEATWVAYDDSGFALAAGTIDKGKEEIAEILMRQKDLAMSHAMPSSSIVRDTEDPSVIVEHQTVEVSVLPRWAAANKWTGLVILDNKESEMAIPHNKVETLINEWGISQDVLDKLVKMNEEAAKKAMEEKRDYKEESQDSQDEIIEETTTEVSTEESTPPEQTSSPLTREEIAEAIAVGLNAVLERLNALEEEVKSLKEKDEERISKMMASTPPASVASLLAQRFSVIGKEDTKVDGRSSLAKSKPSETVAPVTNIPFIDKLLQGNEE